MQKFYFWVTIAIVSCVVLELCEAESASLEEREERHWLLGYGRRRHHDRSDEERYEHIKDLLEEQQHDESRSRERERRRRYRRRHY